MTGIARFSRKPEGDSNVPQVNDPPAAQKESFDEFDGGFDDDALAQPNDDFGFLGGDADFGSFEKDNLEAFDEPNVNEENPITQQKQPPNSAGISLFKRPPMLNHTDQNTLFQVPVAANNVTQNSNHVRNIIPQNTPAPAAFRPATDPNTAVPPSILKSSHNGSEVEAPTGIFSQHTTPTATSTVNVGRRVDTPAVLQTPQMNRMEAGTNVSTQGTAPGNTAAGTVQTVLQDNFESPITAPNDNVRATPHGTFALRPRNNGATPGTTTPGTAPMQTQPPVMPTPDRPTTTHGRNSTTHVTPGDNGVRILPTVGTTTLKATPGAVMGPPPPRPPAAIITPSRKANEESFKEMYHSFVDVVRDFDDKKTAYQDDLLESTVELDLTIAKLLELQCESLELLQAMDDLKTASEDSMQEIVNMK